jgi:hypothetical protein
MAAGQESPLFFLNPASSILMVTGTIRTKEET